MSKITAAIIGAGFMGPSHAEALRRLGVPIRGVLGKDEAESKSAAEAMGLPVAYANLEQLLNDPEVHAVHVTSPNRYHYDHVVAVLGAGKHVLCEKPLALSTEQTADLVARAKASGKVCAVNHNMRYYPLNLEARDRIANGQVGAVHSVVGSYVQDWLLFDTDYNWRVLGSEGGALRAVADIGTHFMDLVQFVTGQKIVEVFADLKVVHPKRKRPLGEVQTFTGKLDAPQATEEIDISTEDQGAVLLRFANGATGSLWVSQATAGRKNCLRYEIAGAQEALYWDSETPNQIWLGSRTAPNQLLMKDPSLLGDTARAHANYPGGHNEGYPDSFKQSFRAFYAAIEGKSGFAPYTTFEDGHREIALCEAVLKSHQEGRWVKVDA